MQNIKFDCTYFKGNIPCLPNKLRDKICSNCDEYIKISKRILIIKLAAIGDVIRTTPLIAKYRSIYQDCHITWLTCYPDILPQNEINQIFNFDAINIFKILNSNYDIAINLDKEIEASALLTQVKAKEKYGFLWEDNHIIPADKNAEHKIITGLFDNISKINTKNYLEEIFEICGYKFDNEEYTINLNKNLSTKWNILRQKAENKIIVGLNTGCGKRWQTRLWLQEYWVELIKLLQTNNFYPILLGGTDEDEQNKFYANETKAYYPGTFSLEEFIAITDNCDIIVSQVSMMMHIATALKKQLILMNNIFNKNEFYLYEKGVIIEPSSGCDCFYGNTCKREQSCMKDILPVDVFENIKKLRIKN